ncbi:MAG: winged helix-turn-helix domain-containing protein [Methanomicrobiales archaeon]|nr:winged helix-turn-helix domain-containing protein [Methanomicrobiales archaeon]
MADLLSIVTTSEKRKNLLLLLQSGPKSMDEIRATLKVTTTGMLPQIKILSSHGLVRKIDGTYTLTDLGGVIAIHLDRLLGTLAVFEQEKEFWKEHDLAGIPLPLRMRIAELGKYCIISSGEDELYESHSEFQEQILRSTRVHGYAPILHPIYPQFFLALAKRGVEISLVLTDSVFARIEKKYGDQLNEGLRYPNASLYVTVENIRLAFIVTDRYFSTGMFFQDGRFDTKLDVTSFDASALAWGEELFRHILAGARQVPLP